MIIFFLMTEGVNALMEMAANLCFLTEIKENIEDEDILKNIPAAMAVMAIHDKLNLFINTSILGKHPFGIYRVHKASCRGIFEPSRR
jgi:ABC-type long-subunit fatty acid transport system fused permease/ATPase subunit